VLTIGAAVADYQFLNHGVNGTRELFSRDLHLGSVASDISSPLALGSTGNGQPPRGLLLGGQFDETTEIEPSHRKQDYFQFRITPAPGKPLNLSLLTFQLRRNDPASKDAYSVYFDEDPGSGGDNFRSKLDIGQFDTVGQFETVNISLRGRPEMTNLITPITFRFYVWGTQGTGDLRLDNIRVHEVGRDIRGSVYAYYSDAGRLISPLDELGNRVADFSAAGFRHGEAPLPEIDTLFPASRIVRVFPGSGDDGSRIQNAIDQVSAYLRDRNGFRGLVQLAAGEYQINGQINIMASGVVLRGAGDGDNPANSTILRATGTSVRSLVVIGNGADPSGVSSTRREFTEKYVPVGATSFEIEDTSGYAVGDEIFIRRPSPQNWISDIGMDQIPPKTNGTTGLVQWQSGGHDVIYERIITRIEGNRVFINAPLMNAMELKYGGASISRLNDPRISNIGIESIRGVSDFTSTTDENHANTFIQIRSARDAWVRNVTGQHFIYATVHADREAKALTVDNARSLDPVSLITGGRRYPFNIEGQFILMKNLYSEEGRHDFVNNAWHFNHGPNVFLNGVAVNSHENSGPHQRWSTGTLYDTLTSDDEFEAIDGGNAGSGHGWRGANMVFWNIAAPDLRMQNPPTAQNWFIGAIGDFITDTRSGIQEAANQDSRNSHIDFGDPDNPLNSLYVAQRNQADQDRGRDRREYLLGDHDLGEFDGALSADAVEVNPLWFAAVDNATELSLLGSMDGDDVNAVLPITFEPTLESNEGVRSAVISIAVRNLDDAQTGEVWLDSVQDRRSFAALGLHAQSTFNRTQVVTMELAGTDLQKFSDGRLDLAISDAVVDWINVQLLVGEPFLAGDYNRDDRVDGADLTIWGAEFGSDSTLAADGNQDRNVDGSDFLLWQRDAGRQPNPPVAASGEAASSLAASALTANSGADVTTSSKPSADTAIVDAAIRWWAEQAGDDGPEATLSRDSPLPDLPAINRASTGTSAQNAAAFQHERPPRQVRRRTEFSYQVAATNSAMSTVDPTDVGAEIVPCLPRRAVR
jgi:hypothetical protein